MNRRLSYQRVISVLLIALFTAAIISPTILPAGAANRRFITELRVEAGAEAVETLEADGWSVMMVGLNVTPDPASQVYLAYKTNTGAPFTNVIVSPDVGDSFTDKNGIIYNCVSHVDADEGIGKGAGCLYATRDERAGAPLVGLDVLRGNNKEGDVLYPITNDGAQIVRTPEGTPADLERASKTDTVYLAQIHDAIVRPYISEIGVITDTDKWNAVYTACERGFNYYVDGDIDDSSDTYTIIGYERTAAPKEAVTNIIALSESAVKSLEEDQGDNKKADALSISGAEYVRISSKPIKAKEPYYIYRTKAEKAGNPISMLYAEMAEQQQNFLFGTWANDYFFSKGVSTAYTYCMNEDLYNALYADQTVCAKIPVRLLENITATNAAASPEEAQTSQEAPQDVAEVAAKAPAQAQPQDIAEAAVKTAVQVQPQDIAEMAIVKTAAQAQPQDNAAGADENAAQAQPQENAAETVENAQEQPQENAAETVENAQEQPQENAAETVENAQAEPQENAPETTEPPQQEQATEGSTSTAAAENGENRKVIKLVMLTPRDGLPTANISNIGVVSDPAAPYIERTQRSERVNKYQASVFSNSGGFVLIPVGIGIGIAAVVIILKKRYDKQKNAKSNKSDQTKNKTAKEKKSR